MAFEAPAHLQLRLAHHHGIDLADQIGGSPSAAGSTWFGVPADRHPLVLALELHLTVALGAVDPRPDVPGVVEVHVVRKIVDLVQAMACPVGVGTT